MLKDCYLVCSPPVSLPKFAFWCFDDVVRDDLEGCGGCRGVRSEVMDGRGWWKKQWDKGMEDKIKGERTIHKGGKSRNWESEASFYHVFILIVSSIFFWVLC